MRILLDENFPVPLTRDFVGHHTDHVIALGWAGTKNGELLDIAEANAYDVFVTFDDDIPKDHDINKRRLAVYVVQPEGQGVPKTRVLIPDILVELESCHAGQARTFTNRTRKQSR